MELDHTEKADANAKATEANAEGNGVEQVDGSTGALETGANAKEASQESINDRLLKESKAWKSKASDAQKELEKLREAEKKRQGKYQEIAEDYKQKLEGLQKKIIKEKVQSALILAAPKFGFAGKSADTLLRLGDASLLQFDEATDEVQGVDVYMESLKKSEPALFRNIDARINDKAPSIDSQIGKKPATTIDEKYKELTTKLGQTLAEK